MLVTNSTSVQQSKVYSDFLDSLGIVQTDQSARVNMNTLRGCAIDSSFRDKVNEIFISICCPLTVSFALFLRV